MVGGRIRIGDRIGKGGFGEVYRGRQSLPHDMGDRQVAIKVVHAEVAEQLEKRMRDEAKLLAMLQYRAIPRFHDFFRIEGRWAVVMDYIEGVSLADVVTQRAVPLGPALEIVLEVARTLHAAWNTPAPEGAPLRLEHRDIKPANLRLTTHGEVWVLDFGIARARFADRKAETRAGGFFGTPEYMAPERLACRTDAGPEADIYAVGTLLYELLTRVQFGMTDLTREEHEARVAAKLLDLIAADVPSAAVDLVASLLAFDVARRPTAPALATAAAELRGRVGGPSLSDWAARVIPPLLAVQTLERGYFTGAVVTDTGRIVGRDDAVFPEGDDTDDTFDPNDSTDSQPAPAAETVHAVGPTQIPEPAPLARRPLRLAVATGVFVVAAGLAWQATRPPESIVDTVETAGPSVVTPSSTDAGIVPAVTGPVGADATPQSAATGAGRTSGAQSTVAAPHGARTSVTADRPATGIPAVREPVDATQPVVGAPPVVPAGTAPPASMPPGPGPTSVQAGASSSEPSGATPASPTTSRVTALGADVLLDGTSGQFSVPASGTRQVPPGEYAVTVTLGDGRHASWGRLTLPSGAVRLDCNENFSRCKVVKED